MVTRDPDPTPSLTNTPSPPCLPRKGLLSSRHFMRVLPACWVPFLPGSLQKTLSSFRAPSLLGVSPSELPALMGCPSPSSSPELPSTKILLLRNPSSHRASPSSCNPPIQRLWPSVGSPRITGHKDLWWEGLGDQYIQTSLQRQEN